MWNKKKKQKLEWMKIELEIETELHHVKNTPGPICSNELLPLWYQHKMVLFHLYNSDSLSSMADCDSCKLKPCRNPQDFFFFFFFKKKRNPRLSIITPESFFFCRPVGVRCRKFWNGRIICLSRVAHAGRRFLTNLSSAWKQSVSQRICVGVRINSFGKTAPEERGVQGFPVFWVFLR